MTLGGLALQFLFRPRQRREDMAYPQADKQNAQALEDTGIGALGFEVKVKVATHQNHTITTTSP